MQKTKIVGAIAGGLFLLSLVLIFGVNMARDQIIINSGIRSFKSFLVMAKGLSGISAIGLGYAGIEAYRTTRAQHKAIEDDKHNKITNPLYDQASTIQKLKTIQSELEKMQGRLLETARAMRASNEYTNIDTLDELKAHIEAKREAGEVPGWVLVGWDGTEESEAKIKEETGFTTRNIPFNAPVKKEKCIVTGKPAVHTVWIARAY